MALRDSPAPFGPGRMRPCTLVATTISSRRAMSRKARPTISSLVPSEYTFAVSKNVMPRSSACLMNGRLASSFKDQGWPPRSGMP
jgi:hypothetical protein